MPRARPKPRPPEVYCDTGPDTPAQRAGAVIAPVRGGRRGEVRKTRQHPLERMHARGQITAQEMEAGLTAVRAYCETLKSPEQAGIYVDKAPDPSAAAVIHCERAFRYAKIVRLVPDRCLYAVRQVIERGGYLSAIRGGTDPRNYRVHVLRLKEAIAALDC